MDQETSKRAVKYQGNPREQKAQAARDLANNQAEKLEKDHIDLGGLLLYIRASRLYEPLGYSSMSEFLSCERVGGLGKTQCYKLMDVASVTAPPGVLAAPMLQAPQINPQSAQLTLPAEVVRKIGTERTYALKRRWRESTPEQREELLDAAQNAPSQDFYQAVYGDDDKVTFMLDGDSILLWQHNLGTKVAEITTSDPTLRAALMDRLNLVPRAKL
jgi:hypothetical protein